MSDSISATHQYLLTHFGPMLTLKYLAEVLHSTPNGLRMAMFRKREPFTVALAGTRRQVQHLFSIYGLVSIKHKLIQFVTVSSIRKNKIGAAQVGRRLFFESRRVAEIIDQDRDESAGCEDPTNPAVL